jgi:hypothetical protein
MALTIGRYVGPALWSMEERALQNQRLPPIGIRFSPVEKEGVRQHLLERYSFIPRFCGMSRHPGTNRPGPKTSTSDEAQQELSSRLATRS